MACLQEQRDDDELRLLMSIPFLKINNVRLAIM